MFAEVKAMLPISGDDYDAQIIREIKACALDLTTSAEIVLPGEIDITRTQEAATTSEPAHWVITDDSTLTDELIITVISIWCNMRIGNPPNYDNLLKVRAIRPDATCQFLTGDASDEMIARLVGDKLDLDVHHSALTEERIAALHAAGIRVNCWTVDEKERAEQLAAWGVDYITSNILEAEA